MRTLTGRVPQISRDTWGTSCDLYRRSSAANLPAGNTGTPDSPELCTPFSAHTTHGSGHTGALNVAHTCGHLSWKTWGTWGTSPSFLIYMSWSEYLLLVPQAGTPAGTPSTPAPQRALTAGTSTPEETQ